MDFSMVDWFSRCRFASRRTSIFAQGLIVLVVLSVAGCAGLPTQFEKNPSVAIPDRAESALGRTAAASMPPGKTAGFRLLPTGDFAFATRIALARRAQRTLDVQYYLFHNDESGRAFGREILAAAMRGVRVRILIDDISTQGQDQLLARLAAQKNLEIRVFNPFPSGRSLLLTRLLGSLSDLSRVNHRMHNKLFIADNAMAITGGRNIGNEYFMQGATSNFIDLDVFAVGDVVPELSNVFDSYWNSDYAYPISAFAPLKPDDAARPIDFPRRAVAVSAGDNPNTRDPLGYGPLAAEIDRGKLDLVWAKAIVVADSPLKVAGIIDQNANATVTRNVVRLMQSADSEVMILSPYFIPGKRGMEVIRALTARGIKMSVLTNSLAANDSPIVHTGYARYRVAMLKLGVRLYELSPSRAQKRGRLGLFGSSRAQLHAKVVIVDQKQIFIGSLNLDARSARDNTELGLIIQSPVLSQQFMHLLNADNFESSYRLRLSAQSGALEWVSTDDGVEHVFTSEPDVGFFLNFGLWLIAPFAPEELL
jgi:putative cardiolipin synthase